MSQIIPESSINPHQVATSDNTGHQQHLGSYSTAFGAVYDFAKTNWQNMIDSRRYRESVRDNRKNATDSYYRQLSLMKEAEKYNSVQNQVRMLREAGLNPALAYGSLGSASVSTPSADQASPASFPSANAPDASIVSNLPAALSESQDILQKSITNKYLDTKNTQEIFKMIAETQKLIADTSLTEEQKENLIKFRDQQLELLKAQTDSQTAAAKQSTAVANYTEGAQTAATKASTDLSKAQTKRVDSEINLNEASASNARASAKLSNEKSKTESNIRDELVSRKDLNDSLKKFKDLEYDDLDLKYKLSKSQRDMIANYCKEHDYNEGVEKAIMLALDNAPVKGLDALESWLDAGNWFPFVSNMVRNLMWKSPTKDDDIPPSDFNSRSKPFTHDISNSSRPTDVVKTIPDDKVLLQHAFDIAKKGQFEKDFIDNYDKGIQYMKNTLTPREFSYVKQDLYYTDDPSEFKEIFYYYYYLTKNQQTITNDRRFHNRD